MKKKFTREEYAKKMERLMEETNYQLKDRESIVQCHAPYPSYWFVSSLGYVISVYRKTIKLVKANHRYTGKKMQTVREMVKTGITNTKLMEKNTTVMSLFIESWLNTSLDLIQKMIA